MKSTVKTLMSFAFASVLILFSCGSDDGGAAPTPTASDVSTTIDENPASGSVLGTITTNLTGTLSFSISSQSVANAFAINATTGDVTVNDGLAFDFESSPTVTAAISVTNSEETATGNVTVSLNDVDDIASFLTTSQAAYNAAATGEWIIVTEAEFITLSTVLNSVFKSGTSDAEYTDATATQTSGPGLYTITNSVQPVIPTGSIVFAFKYATRTGAAITGNKVKVSSTSLSDGYVDLGDPLPPHDGADNDVHFVLKGSNSPTTADGFIAIMMNNGSVMGYKNISGNSAFTFEPADTGTLTESAASGAKWLFQGLSSTQKQWD